jgi:hypothetical protein
MEENKKSIIILDEDRSADGNLKPEVRERIIKVLVESKPSPMSLGPYILARELGVAPQTARSIIQEVRVEWRKDNEDVVEFQKRCLMDWIVEALNADESTETKKLDKQNRILRLFKEFNDLNGPIASGGGTGVIGWMFGKSTRKVIEKIEGDGDNKTTPATDDVQGEGTVVDGSVRKIF